MLEAEVAACSGGCSAVDVAQGPGVTGRRLAEPQPGCHIPLHLQGGLGSVPCEWTGPRPARETLGDRTDHGTSDISRIHPAASELTAVSSVCCSRVTRTVPLQPISILH